MNKCTTFKTEKLPLRGFLLIELLVFKNRTLVGDKSSFLGRLLCGGVCQRIEVQGVLSRCATYDLG